MSAITLENGEKLFDLRVDIRDPKTGAIIKRQPYQKLVCRGGEYDEIYVRDGIRYLPNGECLDTAELEKRAKAAPKAASSKLDAKLDDIEKELM